MAAMQAMMEKLKVDKNILQEPGIQPTFFESSRETLGKNLETPKVSAMKWVPKSAKHKGTQGNVSMVNDDNVGGNVLLNPLLSQIVGQLSKPKFGGKVDDWPQFYKDWTEYVRILRSLMPNQLPDCILLQALKGCLDENTKKELQRKKEANPQLTYTQFWGDLQSEFEGDVNFRHRSAWERVQLTNGQMNTINWRKFCTEFELLKQRVEDRTEQEEYKLIFKQLPEEWRVQVAREESNRRKYKFWVRVSNVIGYSPGELKTNLEAILQVQLNKVILTSSGYLVECGSEITRQTVLEMDGDDIDDRAIRVSKVDKKMDGTEILNFIAERLREMDDLRGLEESLGVKRPEKRSEGPPMKWAPKPKLVHEIVEGPKAQSWPSPEAEVPTESPEANVCWPNVETVDPPLEEKWDSYYTWVQEVQVKGTGPGKGKGKGEGKGKGKGNGKGTGRGKGNGEWGVSKSWDKVETFSPPTPSKGMNGPSNTTTPSVSPPSGISRPPSPAKSAPPDVGGWGKGKPPFDNRSQEGKGSKGGKGGKGGGKGFKGGPGPSLGCLVCLTMGLDSKHSWQSCPKWNAQMDKLRQENSK